MSSRPGFLPCPDGGHRVGDQAPSVPRIDQWAAGGAGRGSRAGAAAVFQSRPRDGFGQAIFDMLREAKLHYVAEPRDMFASVIPA